MTLQERLDILELELTKQIEYRKIVGEIGSTLDYSGIDFERESMLQGKIQQTKEWIREGVK